MPIWRTAINLLAGAALVTAATQARAKTPGTTYCYKDICHRVKTIAETAKDVDRPIHVLASYYDVPWRDRFNPSLKTSSGEIFRALDDDTAASPIYPDGTRLLVYEPRTGGAAVIRVNDAGPYWSTRQIDVSRGVAERLGFGGRGLAHVVTVVLSAPTESEARYDEGRSYAPVPGYMGAFKKLDAARAAWQALPESKLVSAPPPPDIEPAVNVERVVIIGGKASPGSEANGDRSRARDSKAGRVVLKPVKLRRPHLLAARAKRKEKIVKSKRKDKVAEVKKR